jgi:hypothetical protein
MSVGALVAFAVPATASATDVWTDWNGLKHETLGVGKTASQSFEGFLGFTTPSPPLPVKSSFGCNVTVEIRAEGPSGGKVTKFVPTTTECDGTGIFAGCVLREDFSNITTIDIIEGEEEVTENWAIDVSPTPAKVTATSGDLTIHNIYQECPSGVTTSHLEFGSLVVTPNLTGEGTIAALSISAGATNGATIVSGTVTPENGLTLGIETKTP